MNTLKDRCINCDYDMRDHITLDTYDEYPTYARRVHVCPTALFLSNADPKRSHPAKPHLNRPTIRIIKPGQSVE